MNRYLDLQQQIHKETTDGKKLSMLYSEFESIQQFLQREGVVSIKPTI